MRSVVRGCDVPSFLGCSCTLCFLCPVLPLLFTLFDYQAMISQHDGKDIIGDASTEVGKLRRKCLLKIRYIQQSTRLKQIFILTAWCYCIAACAIGKCARWCEWCRCHAALLMESAKNENKRRKLLPGGYCAWMGCRAAEMARGAVDMFKRWIMECTHKDFLDLLHAPEVAQDIKAGIILLLETLRASLVDTVETKLVFWKSLPYYIAAMFDGDKCSSRTSQACAREGRRQWLEIVRAGLEDACHRLTFRIFSDAGPFAGQVEHLAQTGQCPEPLQLELRHIAKVWIVERSIE